MTNVLLITAYFWEPPKKFYSIFWTAVNLSKRGHDVTVISSKIFNCPDHEVIEGIPIYRVPAFYFSRVPWAVAHPSALWKVMDYVVNTDKIDIVHIQNLSFPCSLFSAIYCKRKGLPFIVTARGSYFRLGWGMVPDRLLELYILTAGRMTLQLANKIAVISNGQIPMLMRLGIPREKIEFVPLGVDTSTSTFRERNKHDIKKARQMLNLRKEDFVVGFVGRLAPDKNARLLIEAGKPLSEKIKNLKILVVGSGIAEASLRRKADQIGIGNRVKFLGWREDIDKILPAMDVFVHPSLSDGLGRAFVEAMIVGVPVVASNVPGPSSVVVDQKNGLLVPRNDLSAMIEAIMNLYYDEELRDRLSEEGTKVRKVFSWESCITKLERVYIDVLNKEQQSVLLGV